MENLTINMSNKPIGQHEPRLLYSFATTLSPHPIHLSWYGGRAVDLEPEMTQADFDRLSERGKKMLRNCNIVG